jgi:hypothetical protein
MILLPAMFIGGVYASSTPALQAIIGVWLLNWPHTQNVTITNWPKVPASNATTVVVQPSIQKAVRVANNINITLNPCSPCDPTHDGKQSK